MKTLIIGSSTRTIRAQEILNRHGIAAKIKRMDNTGDGCVRGLLVEDGQANRAAAILNDAGIVVKGTEAGR